MAEKLDEHAFLALNALYLKKMAPAGELPKISGLPDGEVRELASRFADQGWVLDLGGELVIQPEGMTQVQDYYRRTYSDVARREDMRGWYARFEKFNEQFIKLVTDWQRAEGDARAKTQDRVVLTVERLVRLIGEIVRVVPRYTGYVRRFEAGMALVDQGNTDFVCTPTVDSLHNIWFEFHEDFLAVLDRPRDT